MAASQCVESEVISWVWLKVFCCLWSLTRPWISNTSTWFQWCLTSHLTEWVWSRWCHFLTLFPASLCSVITCLVKIPMILCNPEIISALHILNTFEMCDSQLWKRHTCDVTASEEQCEIISLVTFDIISAFSQSKVSLNRLSIITHVSDWSHSCLIVWWRFCVDVCAGLRLQWVRLERVFQTECRQLLDHHVLQAPRVPFCCRLRHDPAHLSTARHHRSCSTQPCIWRTVCAVNQLSIKLARPSS